MFCFLHCVVGVCCSDSATFVDGFEFESNGLACTIGSTDGPGG